MQGIFMHKYAIGSAAPPSNGQELAENYSRVKKYSRTNHFDFKGYVMAANKELSCMHEVN